MRKVFFLVSAFCMVQGLSAQQMLKTDSIITLDNVEISATKKDKVELMNMNVPLNFVPITVTKLDNTTLERKNIVSLEDAVRFLPGVSVTNQYGAFQRFTVRGTTDAAVAYDGIRDERSLMTATPFDDISSVESIEVIKGPASVLSGHSVMGGVINIISKKPTDQFSGNAKLSYGSWGIKQSTIGFGGKLVGPVNFLANLHYSTGDGYRDVGADRFSGGLTLASKLGNTGKLEGNVRFNRDDYRTEIGSAPLMPGDVFRADNDEAFAKNQDRNPMANYKTTYNDLANNQMRVRNIDMSLKYNQKLTDWLNLREQVSYGHRDLDYSAVERMNYRTSKDPIYDWYYFNKSGVKTYIELDSLQSDTPLCFNPDTKSFTQTLDFYGRFNIGTVENNYTVGWNYTFFDYSQYNGYGKDDVWGPGMNQMLPLNNPHTVRDWWDSKVSAVSIRRYNTNGIYLHNVMDINEQWKAMIGGRFDMYNYRRATATIDDGRQHYDRANRTPWDKTETSAFTYRAGVVYFPISSLSFYFSGSSYFKPNTSTYNKNIIYIDNDGNQFNPDQKGGEIFRPEKGHQIELGTRYELNNLLELNASVFYINKTNIVKRLGTMEVEEEGAVINKTVQGQVGRGVTKGFDFDVTIRPLPTLQIVGGLGWSDYRLRKAKVNKEEWPDYTEVTNVRAVGMPRTTFYTYVDYTIPKGIFKDLSFHASGTFTDRIYRSIADNTYFPSLFLVDVGVYYKIKNHIRLSAMVNNLFDRSYFVKTTTLGKPTNFMTSVSYTF